MLEQLGYRVREIRADPLGDMHNNGDIDDAQLQAARSFQALYLKFEFALDRGAELRDLESEVLHIEESIGKPGMYLLHDLAVEGNALSDVWREYDEDYDIARWMFDDGLCRLADYYDKKPNLTPKRQPRASSPQP